MKFKACLYMLFIVSPMLFYSCATKRVENPYEFSAAPVLGMVYDRENKPCGGAAIFIDGVESASTDINGRFVVASLSRGKHTVLAKKHGYEELIFTFEFLNRSQVLYIRVFSLAQLLSEAERAIAERSWEEAERFIERAERIEKDDPVGLYLKAVLFRERGRFDDAVSALGRIIDLGFKEPYVYLALADIFQYDLNDMQKAAEALEKYLDMKEDSDIRDRLEDLADE